MGFDNCPLFTQKGTIEKWPKKIKPPLRDCPLCGWRKGNYRLKEIRMVTKVKSGVKFGKDVHSWTSGVEVGTNWCVIM